jgi:hypothetical protein
MTRALLTAATLLVAVLAVAGAAYADGLPVVGVEAGPGGVEAPQGDARYHAVEAGSGTVVTRIEVQGGRLLASRFLPGRFAVPVVAFDGTSSGVSADGTVLAVIRPRLQFPRARTTLALLDASSLTVRRIVRLDGDFSFDALSPDGRSLYLIQYTDPGDPTRYLVRVFDVDAGRLVPDPIVDPSERPDGMRGLPITRAVTPDGRWAYTLYDGAGAVPFVHALDTEQGTAVCVDLDALVGYGSLFELRLAVDPTGGGFAVVHGPTTLARVDAPNFAVSEPAEPAATRTQTAPAEAAVPAAKPEPPRAERAGGGVPSWSIGAGVAGVLLAGGLLAAVRKRRSSSREPAAALK